MDILNPQDEEEKKKVQSGQITAANGQVVTGQSTAPVAPGIAPAGGQPTSTVSQNKVAGSGKFQNLQKFMTANEGGGEELGNKIKQDITQSQQNVQGKIDPQQQNITNAVAAEKTRLQNVKNLVTQATQDASTFVGDVNNKQQIQAALAGNFQQQSIAEMPDIQKNLQGLNQKAQQVGSESGRFDLLRQNFALPNYSKGATRVDQLLLQAAPGVLNQISSLAQDTSKQNDAFTGLQNLTGASNKDLETLAESTAQDINSRLAGDITSKRGVISQRAKDAYTGLQEQRSAIESKLKTATALSNEDMDSLGIPANERKVFNELVSLRGPEILNRITVQNTDNSRYDITGDALKAYEQSNLLDSIGSGFIAEKEFRPDPKLEMAKYLKTLDEAQFNENNVVNAEEMEDINILNQLLGKGDVYQGVGTLPGLGYDYRTAIGKGLAEIAPKYRYDSAVGEIADEEGKKLNSVLDILKDDPKLALMLPGMLGLAGGQEILDLNTKATKKVGELNKKYMPKPLRVLTAPAIDLSAKITGATSKAATSLTRAASNLFCFAKGTSIEMADGSRKNIEDIKLGDIVALGGRVVAHGMGYCESVYEYKGIKASESHTVYHRGEFMRLKNCLEAKYFTNEETIVYPICTENHLLVSDAKIFTDTYEHENQDLTYDEIIYELNSDTNKIVMVEDYLYKRTR